MIITEHGDQIRTGNLGTGSATADRKAAPTPRAVPGPGVPSALILAATRAKFAREAFYNLPADAPAEERAQLLRAMNTAEDAHREKLFAHLKAEGRIR